MPRTGKILAVLAAAIALTAACGGNNAGGSGSSGKQRLSIGFVTTLSNNAFSGVGEQSKAAFEAAIAQTKADNPDLSIKTSEGDDQGDPRQATQTCQRLVRQEHVQVIVAVMLTPNKNACNLIAQQAKVPFIAGQQSAVNCGPTYFQTGWVPHQIIDPALNYLASTKAKKLYFVGNDYAFDQGILSDLKKAAPAKGITVVGSSMAPVGTTTWSAIFARVAAAKPDFVIDAMVDEVAYQKQASVDPQMTALKRLSFTADEAQLHAAGAKVKGLRFVTQYVSSADNPANTAFKAALAKANPSVRPSLTSVNLYNAALAAIAAAKDGTTSANIMSALPKVSVDGPGGPVAFAGSHNPTMTSYVALMGDNFVPSVEYTEKSVVAATGC
jgi:urea transport system substrate-binding protein